MRDNKKVTFYSIQYIRGIAAMMVVLFHFRTSLNGVYSQQNLGDLMFRWGEIGVDAFFIISGFIICFATKNDKSIKSFTLKRFFRIYPAYIMFLFAIMASKIIKNEPFSDEIISSLLIQPLDINKGSPFYGYSFMVVAWSLFYEICFYIIYGVSMAISHRYRNIICSSLIVLICMSTQIIFNGKFTLSPLGGVRINEIGIFNVMTSSMMLTFIIGIILFEIVDKLLPLLSRLDKKLSIFMLSMSLSFFMYCYMTGFNSWHGITNSVVFIAPAIFMLVIYESVFGIKKIKPLMMLGNISYSLYLSHTIASMYLYNYAGDFYHISAGFSRLLILLTVCISVSYVSYIFIEKPSMSICRKMTSVLKSGKKINLAPV